MPHKREQQELEREILALTDRLIENTIELSLLTGEEFEGKKQEGINIVVRLATVLEEYLGGSPEHFAQVIRELARQKLPDENILTSFGNFSAQLDEAIHEGLRIYHENRPPAGEDEAMDPTGSLSQEAENVTTPTAAGEEETAGEDIQTAEGTVVPSPEVAEESMDPTPREETLAGKAGEEDPGSPVSLATGAPIDFSAPEQLDTGLEEAATGSDASRQEAEAKALAAETDSVHKKEDTPSALQDNWETALKMIFPEATIIKNHTVKGLSFSYYLPEHGIAVDVNPLDAKETVWKEYYCRQQNIRLLSIVGQDNWRLRHIIRNLRLSLAQNAGQNIS